MGTWRHGHGDIIWKTENESQGDFSSFVYCLLIIQTEVILIVEK
jgi:hypothetical protein